MFNKVRPGININEFPIPIRANPIITNEILGGIGGKGFIITTPNANKDKPKKEKEYNPICLFLIFKNWLEIRYVVDDIMKNKHEFVTGRLKILFKWNAKEG